MLNLFDFQDKIWTSMLSWNLVSGSLHDNLWLFAVASKNLDFSRFDCLGCRPTIKIDFLQMNNELQFECSRFASNNRCTVQSECKESRRRHLASDLPFCNFGLQKHDWTGCLLNPTIDRRLSQTYCCYERNFRRFRRDSWQTDNLP